MSNANLRRVFAGLAGFAAAAVLLTGCGSGDPLATDNHGAGDNTIVIGSQDYYSNEIVAEIYAQALEEAGYNVDRQFRIGQREIYLPELESGKIDLFPEYTGPLLQYWDADTDARLTDDVYESLQKATPEGLQVLQQSPATDQDSYVVTEEFANTWNLRTIADLQRVTDPLTLGANSEAEQRPNGPKGLQESYGVSVGFTPIEDGGGSLTVKALRDNDIQLAIIYTADPSIKTNKLVALEDTAGLFLASHVVPLASADLDPKAAEVVNRVSEALTAEDLVQLNARSVNEQLSAEVIARDWLQSR